jgi:membrane protein YdbS with pleckstrin-like domain
MNRALMIGKVTSSAKRRIVVLISNDEFLDAELIFFSLQYAIFLALLLMMEMTAGVLGFIFKDWVNIINIKIAFVYILFAL